MKFPAALASAMLALVTSVSATAISEAINEFSTEGYG